MRRAQYCAMVLAGLTATGAGALQADNVVDRIHAASAAWDKAYNEENIDQLMKRYHEDAVSMAPGFPASVGREAIRGAIAGFLSNNDAHHNTDIKEVVVRDEIAIERAEYSHEIQPDDGDTVFEQGTHVIVYQRGSDGVWRVLWEIWNTGQ